MIQLLARLAICRIPWNDPLEAGHRQVSSDYVTQVPNWA